MPNGYTSDFPDHPHRNINATTTGTVVKTGLTSLFSYDIYNVAAAVVYVKFYDKATAPTASDTPVFTIGVPAASRIAMNIPDGVRFDLGLTYRASTLVADADNTAPASNNVNLNLTYQ